MMAWIRRCAILLLPLLASAASQGSPAHFDLGDYDPPPVIEDTTAPRACTVTYLVEDYVSNETFAQRMQFTPPPDAVALRGHLPCPAMIPPRVAERALDSCRAHADKKTDCVFADMTRGFDTAPNIANTSENASRCASDLATQMAIACWNSGKFDVCNVACGIGRGEAILAARNRCEAKHVKTCTITGALPVQAP